GFLPSALTAFGAQASRLHFFRKLLSAAPASGLPFLSIALLAHVSCAIAGPIAKAAIMAAKTIPFMELPPVGQPVVYSKNCGSQQPQHITRQRRRPASGPIACLLRHRRESTRSARLAHHHARARQTGYWPPTTNSAGAFRRTPAVLPERRRSPRRRRNSPPPRQCRAGNRDR